MRVVRQIQDALQKTIDDIREHHKDDDETAQWIPDLRGAHEDRGKLLNILTLCNNEIDRLNKEIDELNKEIKVWAEEEMFCLDCRDRDKKLKVLEKELDELNQLKEQLYPSDTDCGQFYCLAEGHEHLHRYDEALCSAKYQLNQAKNQIEELLKQLSELKTEINEEYAFANKRIMKLEDILTTAIDGLDYCPKCDGSWVAGNKYCPDCEWPDSGVYI